MAKKAAVRTRSTASQIEIRDDVEVVPTKKLKPSALLDTRVIYCGDNLEQLAKLPDACVDLIYIDPPFNSNRNYDGGQSGTDFWGETKEKRAVEDRHENTKAYIDYMRPRCDWHASHYVKVKADVVALN
jgi:16S rRNA G966 N2-methylase RsmD